MIIKRTIIAICACTSFSLEMQAVPLQPDTLFKDSLIPQRVQTSSGNIYEEFNASAPHYAPKSPTVSGLVTQIDYPVSHYTGIPDISIPIYEIEAYGMKMPITLSYHASGIRLDQEASWVGLGWSLNVGGVISRTIKCVDDFMEYGSVGNIIEGYLTAPELNAPVDSGYIQMHYNPDEIYTYYQVMDSEPDIFYYSLPVASGKFLIDKSRGPVLLNRNSGLKIEINNETVFRKYFVITTPDGIRYTFRKYETTTNHSRYGFLNENLPNAIKYDEYENKFDIYDTPISYTSSWMLTDVESVNGRHITFNYESESYQSPLQENIKKYNIIETSIQNYTFIAVPPMNPVYNCSKVIVDTWRLSSIVWDAGRIDFHCSNRQDEIGSMYGAPPMKLDSITVSNNIGDVVKQYGFVYSYFNNSYNGNYSQVFKRLKLNRMENLADTTVNYTFLYYEDKSLPAKNCKDTDYWGYWNGIQQRSKYYCPITYNGVLYGGGDKSSHLEYMRVGTLRSFTGPTKGCTTFTYETNKYKTVPTTSVVTHHISEWMNVFYEFNYDLYSQYPRTESDTIHVDSFTPVNIAGFAEVEGCIPDSSVWYDHDSYPTFRISKIKNNGSLQTIFYYPSPSELLTNCSYTFPDSVAYLSPGDYVFEAIAQTRDTWYAFRYDLDKTETITSDSIIQGGGLRVSQISGAVTKNYTYDGGILLVEPFYGQIERFKRLEKGPQFSGYDQLFTTDYIVQNSTSSVPMSTLKDGNIFGYTNVTETIGNSQTIYTFHNEQERQYPYTFHLTPSILNCRNGLLLSKSHGGGIKTEELSYEYRVANHEVKGFVFDQSLSVIYEYSYNIEWPLLSWIRTTTIESNGILGTLSCYTYDDNFMTLTEDVRGSDIYEKRYIYPTIQSTDTVIRSMAMRHMIGVPLETLLLKNGVVVDGRRTEYIDTLSMVLPKTEYELDSKGGRTLANYGGSMIPKVYYRHYNAYGKPMEVWERGQTTSYLWAWNGLYPIVQINNATYADLVNYLGVTTIAQMVSANTPDNASMNAVEGFRIALPTSFTTTFDFKPLIGVTAITDPRGLTTHYEYDAIGRLIETYIVDPSGRRNTIEQYDYHYAE